MDLSFLQNQVDYEYFFRIARQHYNELLLIDDNVVEFSQELPDWTSMDDLVIEDKTLSILLKHSFSKDPAVSIYLEIVTREDKFPIGYYQLIVDTAGNFIDEFLVVNPLSKNRI